MPSNNSNHPQRPCVNPDVLLAMLSSQRLSHRIDATSKENGDSSQPSSSDQEHSASRSMMAG